MQMPGGVNQRGPHAGRPASCPQTAYRHPPGARRPDTEGSVRVRGDRRGNQAVCRHRRQVTRHLRSLARPDARNATGGAPLPTRGQHVARNPCSSSRQTSMSVALASCRTRRPKRPSSRRYHNRRNLQGRGSASRFSSIRAKRLLLAPSARKLLIYLGAIGDPAGQAHRLRTDPDG
jgi:hypothetical protein